MCSSLMTGSEKRGSEQLVAEAELVDEQACAARVVRRLPLYCCPGLTMRVHCL